MNRTLMKMVITLGLALCVAITSASGQTATGAKSPGIPETSASQDPSAGQSAMQRAAEAHKYIFLFFYHAEDGQTQAARKVFDAAMVKLTDRAISTTVRITDPQEKALVNKYGLDRAPMPLLLAVAPNGAVTRSFPVQFTEAQLDTAFVSSGMQKCLKALQDRKMAFICVQSSTTRRNAEAMKGVKEFVANAQYAKTTEIIIVDPTDAAEESLLKQFKVDPKTNEAVTVFLAPPGTTVGTYKGETKQDVLIAAAKTAAKGCDPKSGCCAPKKS